MICSTNILLLEKLEQSSHWQATAAAAAAAIQGSLKFTARLKELARWLVYTRVVVSMSRGIIQTNSIDW